MNRFCLFLLAAASLYAQTATVSATINPLPSREFGQPSLLPSGLNSVAPNLVEGRELNFPSAVAFDTSASPPILYISDTSNNRVLAYQNPAALSNCGLNNPTCGFANLVIGQNNLTGTLPGGPNEPGLSFGFYQPTGLAVDAKGNLYVADTENNRILRFPSPFKQIQTSSLVSPDLIIGQPNLTSNQANQGQNIPTNQTLSLSSGNFRPVALAFDSSGNLWVTDPGNNRLLRYPVGQLVANTEPAADTVLGQTNFTSNSIPTPPSNVPAVFVETTLNQPLGLAFDSSGNLYVSDSYSRVLYFQAPLSTGMSASRVLGVIIPNQQNPYPNINQYALDGVYGLAVSSNHLYATDLGDNRIAEYDVPANWPAAANLQTLTPGQQYCPPILNVYGQENVNVGTANQGKPQAASYTLNLPLAIAFNGTDMWVADAYNNRVLDFPQQSGTYGTASRLVGQLNYIYSAANLIEGREVYFSGSQPAGGIAVDHNSNPPHMYVADTYNNRILCFKDSRSVQSTSTADMVLGQSTPTDFFDNLLNSGTNSVSEPTQTGLYEPVGVVVAPNGDLYVTDSGNSRVLRYPAPYAQTASSQQLPNLVLGQSGFTGPYVTDPTSQNMHTPWGIGLLSTGSLVVSDAYDNRILVFTRPSGGDFQNGQAASLVLGQSNFTSITKSASTGGLNSPTALSIDSSDRVYLCDTGNNRIVVFTNIATSTNGATSAFQLNNFSEPQGITVNQTTGEIWIANTASNTIYRFPQYTTVILYATPNNYSSVVSAQIPTQTGPLGLALDDSNNLIVAEEANRITFFFAELTFASEASYNNLQLAPGELAGISQVGLPFSFTQDYNPNASSGAFAYPWPTSETVNDLEILVSATGMSPTPAPLFRVDPTFISFQVPSSTPPSGTAIFQLIHPSTGQIIGEGDFQMSPYQPAFFTANAQGTGQVAAFNIGPEYSTCSPQPACQINGPSNAIPNDGTHYIGFCLTGGGLFQGGPPDGNPPTGAANTAVPPQLISANGFLASQGLVPPANIQYSGAGCDFAGGWQITLLVPNTMPASNNNVIAVTLGDVPSTLGNNGQTIQVWFSTKQ